MMTLLNELKKDVLNNTKSKAIYEDEQQLYELCKKLKQIRQRKHFTQKDIAAKTGMSQQMVSKIESYNGNPSMLSFFKYCKSIGIDLCKLIK
ncbi:MAG: helix-turn-helix domain-containing protein [Anaerobutyricum hallii]